MPYNSLPTPVRSLLGDSVADEGQDCPAIGRIRDLDELIEELEHLLSNVGLARLGELGIGLTLRVGQRRREVAKKPGDVDAKMAGDAGEQGGRRALLAGLEARQERGGEAQVVGKMLELDLEEQSTQPDSSPDEAVHSRRAICPRSAARGVLFDGFAMTQFTNND
jgi:hypothetical protein